MYQTACPHCSNPLIDDGTLAGQIVMCPRCSGQMQMPSALAPNSAWNEPPVFQSPSVATPSLVAVRSHHKKPRSQGNSALITGGLVAAFIVLAAFGFYVANQSGEPTVAVNQAKKRITPAKEDSIPLPAPVQSSVASEVELKQDSVDEPDQSNAPAESQPRETTVLPESSITPEMLQAMANKWKVNDREKELISLKEKFDGRIAAAESNAAKQSELVDSLKKQIKDTNSRAGVRTSKSQGVTVIQMDGVNQASLDKQLKPLEDKLALAKSELVTETRIANSLKAEYWLAKREVMKRIRLGPEEPELFQFKGMLYTAEELALVRPYFTQFESPENAADYYVAELLNRGVLRSASRSGRVNSPFDTVRFAYSVEYVSIGGVVNVRQGYVDCVSVVSKGAALPGEEVYLPDGTYWNVTLATNQAILLGLP